MEENKSEVFYTDAENNYGNGKPFFEHDCRPYQVTIKPTMSCPARCAHCTPRQKRFPEGAKILGLDGWRDVFKELKSLGSKSICISGGEPMMYKDIFGLASAAKELSLRVSLNTSGWFFHKEENLRKLAESGVSGIHLSIDSPEAKTHDSLRGLPGLHERAVSSVHKLLSIKPDMLINVRMILHRYTYRSIPEMLTLAYNCGATSLSIDHIQHDREAQKFLLSSEQIQEFRSKEMPRIIETINSLPFENEALRALSVKQVGSFFSPKLATNADYENGIYWKDQNIRTHCTVPSSFMIIEGDGTILPCNPVEYTRHPLMGNLNNSTIKDMWASDVWEEFRKNKMDYCTQCTMNQSRMIPFRKMSAPTHVKRASATAG